MTNSAHLIVINIENQLQLPYVVPTQYEQHHTADDAYLQYQCLYYKATIALNVTKLLVLSDTNIPQGQITFSKQ